MSPSLLYAAMALASGFFIPVMAALNGGLGRLFGHPAWASVLLLGVGCVAALVFAVLVRAPLPAWPVAVSAPKLTYAAGLGVAFYILSATFLAPRFGVANFVMFVLLAQLASAAMIDRFGLFGVAARPLEPLRVFGIAVMLGGIVLCQWRR